MYRILSFIYYEKLYRILSLRSMRKHSGTEVLAMID